MSFWNFIHHIPVFYTEAVDAYIPASGKCNIVVDATLGLGGHTAGLIAKMWKNDIFLGIDRDAENLVRAREYIDTYFAERTENLPTIHLVHRSFADISAICTELHIDYIDYILYDLGISSVHVDQENRGFSFRYDSPLDMRYDRSVGHTAAHILSTYPERDIYQILRDYGEEKKAIYIARGICTARAIKNIDTTGDLVEIISKSSFDKQSIVRCFQALRICVNDEFWHIERSVHGAISLLCSGGRISVISFHSLEDRLVKHILASYMESEKDDITGQDIVPAILCKVTKKPIVPTDTEIRTNPRSRSAKLRIAQKV